jgi:hypothetical protein
MTPQQQAAWNLRGMEMAEARARADPAFRARYEEAVAKALERRRQLRGLMAPRRSQIESLEQYANIVLGRDLRREP